MRTTILLVAVFGLLLVVQMGFGDIVEPFISFMSWVGGVIVFGLAKIGEMIVSGLVWLGGAIASLFGIVV